MKRFHHQLSGLLLLSIIFFSCQKQSIENVSSFDTDLQSKSADPSKSNTYYGPQVQLGNGKVRTFVRISHTGNPEEIGVEITKGALTGLPSAGS